jgi:putative RNA 2'-phosphotransferase
MNEERLVKISKYLSKHLRHQPERLGIKLAPGGWVSVDELLAACAKNSFPISREELDRVVENNDKKRFSFDSTSTLIRANQGHSVEIDLQLKSAIPPDVLYHGTGHLAVELIRQSGLCKMSRHHVHLSTDMETARRVGMRHGKPVVFAVDAVSMQTDGYMFYCSDNGVWLVDSVPPKYLLNISPTTA